MLRRPYSEPVDIAVLGPLRVEDAGGPIEIRGAKERLLLARLVAARGRVVPAADLIDTLWGEDPPPSAAKSLQTFVLRLRNALEPERAGRPSLLVTDGPGYRLDGDAVRLDADRFARLTDLGRRALEDGRADTAAATLEEALTLWRGPAYAGFEDSSFASAEAHRLDELRLGATEACAAADTARGRADIAVAELERVVSEHPLREHAWELLVAALYRAGRQGDALQAYDRARTVLAEELGVDPGPGLRQVHAQVLSHDPGLAAPVSRTVLPPGLRPARVLVGRDEELARLRHAWDVALREGPRTVVLRGPAGSGTSALAAALGADVARAGAVVTVRDSPTQTGAGPPDGERPRGDHHLAVADHVDPALNGYRPTLVLVLADPSTPPTPPTPATSATPATGDDEPTGPPVDVIDLAPLSPEDVRTLVATYVDVADVDAVTSEVVGASTLWPADIHARALEAARTRAARRVAAAAVVTGETSATLASARAELADGIAALRDTPAPDADTTQGRACPWRGLTAYDIEDAPWFHGRERLVAETVARLAGSRFVALVGASGAGKSSTLRAGLLAAIGQDVLAGSAGWRVVAFRPGKHPLRQLARQSLGQPNRDEVADLLTHLVTAGPEGDRRVIVAVDQLEEAWTLCADEGERQQFLDTLTELATDPRVPVSVVVAVRADFLDRVAEHAGLRAVLGDGTLLVGPMTPAELRRAVERPAALAGLVLDDGLAETVVHDAGGEPGLLPLLSTALAQLWERREGRSLTYAGYVALGGLAGAIATLAEETWDGFGADEQVAARAVLLRLAGPGEGAEVTRRRVAVAELESLAVAGVPAVLDQLVAARLLTRSDGAVEVAHEALFREWPRLRSWLAEESAGRAIQHRLALAAAEWDAEGRDAAQLWGGTRLAAGLDAAAARPDELTAVEREFLEAGRDAVDADRRAAEERAVSTARQNRRLRWLLAGIALVLVAALVAGLLAWRSRQEASASALTADARRLAATALTMDYPDTALLAAVEATKLESSPETQGALLTLLARQPAVVHRIRTPNRFLRNAASPDGRTVYVSENAGRLWSVDAETGRVRWTVTTPEGGQVGNLSVTPDGTGILATMYRDPVSVLTRLSATDGSVVWELASDDLPDVSGAGEEMLHWGGFDGAGHFVVQTDRHVYAVDPASGRVVSSRPWPADMTGPMESLVVWPDGRVSRQVGFDPAAGSVVVDALDASRPAQRVAGTIVAVSPDGRRIAVSRGQPPGGTLRLVDTATLKDVGEPIPLEGEARAGAFSPDGRLLAVTADNTVVVYDSATLATVHTLDGHNGTAMSVAFAGRDHDLLWTASRDGTAVGFDLSGSRTTLSQRPIEARVMTGQGPRVGGTTGVIVHFFDDAPNVAELVDLASGDVVQELPIPGAESCGCQVTTVAMTPDGATAIVSVTTFTSPSDPEPKNETGRLLLWDVASKKLTRTIDLPEPAFSLALSTDSQRAVANGMHGVMRVDLGAGRVTGHLRDLDPAKMYGDQIPQIALSPDGRLAAVARVGMLALVDVATMKEVRRLDGITTEGQPLGAVTFSADGRTVVAGDFAGWIHFLGADDLRAVAPKRLIAAGFVIGASISPDGSVLASLGTDGELTLWDTATWRPYGKPLIDDQAWGFVHFPDEQHVQVMYDNSRMVRVGIDRDAWVQAACSAAGRNLTADETAIVLPGRPVPTTCRT